MPAFPKLSRRLPAAFAALALGLALALPAAAEPAGASDYLEAVGSLLVGRR